MPAGGAPYSGSPYQDPGYPYQQPAAYPPQVPGPYPPQGGTRYPGQGAAPTPQPASRAAQAKPLAPSDPTWIGPYRVAGLLGRGGMGSVYLAHAPGGRLVAIKRVRAEHAADPEFRRLFEREARLARRVARFCTAEVLDYGDDAGHPYLVTEYVDGPTLHEDVHARGPFERGRLERLAVAVATALGAIHQAGAVHRDLKPANVLLSPDGPLVIDFGIAQALDSTTQLTRDVSGTPAFMAPEQARGERVGPPADVFAWGGVVTFAATGRSPFGTGRPEVLLYRVVHEWPDLTGVPSPLRDLVALAMDRDPARRPSAAQLLSYLMESAPGAGGALAAANPFAAPAVPPWNGGALPDLPPTARVAGPGPLPAQPRTPVPARPAARPASTPLPGGAALQLYADGAGPAGNRRRRPAVRFTRRRAIVAGAAVVTVVAVAVPLATRESAAPVARETTAPAVSATATASPSPMSTLTTEQRAQAAKELAAAALTMRADQPELAARLAAAAYRTSPIAAARAAVTATLVTPAVARSYSGLTTKGSGPAAVSADGTRFAVTGTDGKTRLWRSTGTTAPVATLSTGKAALLRFSPDGSLLATVGADGVTRLWSTAKTGTVASPLAVLNGKAGRVRTAVFSSDGGYLATGADNGATLLWATSERGGDAKPVASLNGKHGAVTAAAFGPSNTVLAAATADGSVLLWGTDGHGGAKAIATLTGHKGAVNALAFSANGKLLATAGSDATARLWDTTKRGAVSSPRATLSGKGAGSAAQASLVTGVAFSPDSTLVATTTFSGTARLWSASSKGAAKALTTFVRSTLPKGAGPVFFGASGSTLVTTSDDGTTRIWDVSARGTTKSALVSLYDTPGPVALSPDGRFLVGPGSGSAMFLRDLDPARLAEQACANPADALTAAEWARYVTNIPFDPPCA